MFHTTTLKTSHPLKGVYLDPHRSKLALLNAGVSQGELAERLGRNRSFLNSALNGRRSLSIGLAERIATALKVTREYLQGE